MMRTHVCILLMIFSLSSLTATAAESYACFESQVRVGDANTGGAHAGMVYYLSGGPRADFMDEVMLTWNGQNSSADLRCADGNPNLCYLGEDSGRLWVKWRAGVPTFVMTHRQIYAGIDDGYQHHIYVIPARKTQILHFMRMPQSACDQLFPDAAGRGIFIGQSPTY